MSQSPNMKIYDQSAREVNYQVNSYPDGQQDVIIKLYDDNTGYVTLEGKTLYAAQIRIRLTSFKDLELLICAKKALENMGCGTVMLTITYLLGARSDRKFVKGGVNYLKDVICPIINSLNFTKVSVYDAHSDITEALINNYDSLTNAAFAYFAYYHIIDTSIGDEDADNPSPSEDLIIISPDAGALKKIYNVAKYIGYTNDIIIASKHRNLSTGKITHTEVPLNDSHIEKSFLIVDDIGDGFGTFIAIAKVIKEKFPLAKLYLAVTHSIQAKGLLAASEWFDHIYTTNSYADWDLPNVTKYKVF